MYVVVVALVMAQRVCMCCTPLADTCVSLTGFQLKTMPTLAQLQEIHQAQLAHKSTHKLRLAKQRINNAMNRAW